MSQVEICFRWNGKEVVVEADGEETLEKVKEKIWMQTSVHPQRQKLLGLKASGKLATDDTKVTNISIKPGQKFMLMGTPDDVISETEKQAAVAPSIRDDFDLDPNDNIHIDLKDKPEIQQKLKRRIENVEVKVLNPPRRGKHLLVLDIDYTIFDLDSSAERPDELARPYLHQFLTAAYNHFDLMIWSATSMKWVEVKMRELGVSTNPNYKIVCMLDQASMLTVHNEKYGIFSCKPLAFIWSKFKNYYNETNTVMIDDLRRNFVMNRQNGLVIEPYRKAHANRQNDRELLDLITYFMTIGSLKSLSHLNHRKWRKYLEQYNSEHSFEPSEGTS